MKNSYVHVFPALRGVQGGREYYVSMCPLRLVPRLFQFNESDLPSNLRAQRVLNDARVPAMAAYLADNSKDYVFSSLAASIDGQVNFEPVDARGPGRSIGSLSVPMDARIIINDGQHRRAAIEEALHLKPELGDEHISVVFFLDRGLKRSQQMFADLNKNAVRPSKSLGILFDHRDPLSRLACAVAQEVPVFRDLVELEKTSISNRSIKLFTLSSLYQATKALLGKGGKDSVGPEEEALAIRFWSELSAHMPDWQLAAERKVASAELRQNYVHAHGVVLHALGIAGGQLLAEEPKRWPARLTTLETVDWNRSNAKLWEGRALVNGQVSKAHKSLLLTASYLKTVLGVTLRTDEKEAERALRARK